MIPFIFIAGHNHPNVAFAGAQQMVAGLRSLFATEGLQDKASVYPAGLVFSHMVPPNYAGEERTQGAAFISV